MRKDKKERLEKAGWRVGSAKAFLGLSDAESAIIEVRLMLAQALRNQRIRLGMSQAAVAKGLGSSQSRVAKMESGDPSVSLDLLMRALLAMGATTAEIGKAIANAHAA